MAKALKDYPHIIWKAEYNLPVEFTQEIGVAVVRWAYYERIIQKIVWLLVDAGETVGSYAVREPRITERIEMIRDLAAFRSLNIDQKRLDRMGKVADWALKTRDLVAHGIWGRVNGEWVIEHRRGQHSKDEDVPHRSRRSFPGGIIMNVTELQRLTKVIEKLIIEAVALEKAVHGARQASLKKSS